MKILKYLDKLGTPNSVYPPTTYLTNGPWIYMVPQFKPENVLMLGYAGGTVAGLIRLVYGDVPITAVDLDSCENKYNVKLIQANAKEFVKQCKDKFDVVIIDLYPNNSLYICDFVVSKDFVDNIERIANYIILSVTYSPDLSEYNRFKKYGMNKPNRLSNQIFYYSTKEISNLFPYKT